MAPPGRAGLLALVLLMGAEPGPPAEPLAQVYVTPWPAVPPCPAERMSTGFQPAGLRATWSPQHDRLAVRDAPAEFKLLARCPEPGVGIEWSWSSGTPSLKVTYALASVEEPKQMECGAKGLQPALRQLIHLVDIACVQDRCSAGLKKVGEEARRVAGKAVKPAPERANSRTCGGSIQFVPFAVRGVRGTTGFCSGAQGCELVLATPEVDARYSSQNLTIVASFPTSRGVSASFEGRLLHLTEGAPRLAEE